MKRELRKAEEKEKLRGKANNKDMDKNNES